jgi:hypothetical protein
VSILGCIGNSKYCIHIALVQFLCPLTEKKVKTMSAHTHIDTGNLLSNISHLEEGGLMLQSNPHTLFVSGLFLSLLTAQETTPLLQTVYQADAAHMNFGKHTPYSCNGLTANCNGFPVFIGIVFGNKDKEGLTMFWVPKGYIHVLIPLR